MRLLALFLRARFVLPLGAAALLLFMSGAALADETPFDFESSNWMSFDRYKDQPAHWLAPDQRAEVSQQVVIAPPPVMPASMPVLTEPTRPIIAPVMPGLNKGFDMRVDTTEDSNRLPVAESTVANNPAGPPQDNQWKDAVEAARIKAEAKKDGDKEDAAFAVRLASLPPWTVPQKKALSLPVKPIEKSTPAPSIIAQPTAAASPPSSPPTPPAVSTADAAACAALDTYKKRQLQAIQSDRETLTALQGAIAKLGLQKQLDFMPGTGGSLSTQVTDQQPGLPAPAASSKN